LQNLADCQAAVRDFLRMQPTANLVSRADSGHYMNNYRAVGIGRVSARSSLAFDPSHQLSPPGYADGVGEVIMLQREPLASDKEDGQAVGPAEDLGYLVAIPWTRWMIRMQRHASCG
jgi:hypothetical protein